jgi:MFS family permease
VNVTRHDMRAMAFAVNIFIIHALGDAISPAFIGFLSDHVGLGRALLSTVAAIMLAALFCLLCAEQLPLIWWLTKTRYNSLQFTPCCSIFRLSGEMSERLKEHAWKACVC